MQALWSRAAQNSVTCRYVQCALRAPGSDRNAVVLGIKGSWPFGSIVYTRIFTAGIGRGSHNRKGLWEGALSSLLEETGTGQDDRTASQPRTQEAPVPEGRNKLRKRAVRETDQLQVQIEAISLADDIPTCEESLAFIPDYVLLNRLWPRGVDFNSILRVSGTELTDTEEITVPHTIHDSSLTEDGWELLSIDSMFPETQGVLWPANTGQELIRHHLPPQSLWSHNHVREKALMRRQTWKKTLIQEFAMGLLTMSLLDPARTIASPPQDCEDIAPSLRDSLQFGDLETATLRGKIHDARHYVEGLRGTKSDVDFSAVGPMLDEHIAHTAHVTPKYNQDRDGHFYNIQSNMNGAIKAIFDRAKHFNSDRELAMALLKVAHNLFVSSAPPNIHTFNILICGLKRLGLRGLVEDAISALKRAKVRPNELTCAAILDYYVQTNQPGEFILFVTKMRGGKGALMLARPDITINEAGADRLVRDEKKAKVYQKVYPTPMVFNSLILGVRKFAGIERTLEIYLEMKWDGWGLDVLGLSELLVDCVRRSDWHNGLYIWTEISSIRQEADLSHVAKAYSNMLSLCVATENAAAFNQLVKEMTKWSKETAIWQNGVSNFNINPKSLIESAMKFAENVRLAQLAPVEPAAADKVFDAVSGYMDEHNASRESVEQRQPAIEGGSPQLPMPMADVKPKKVVISKEEAWSAWLDYELGLMSGQSSKEDMPIIEMEQIPGGIIYTLQKQKAMNTEEAWQAWVEHELGLMSGKTGNRKRPVLKGEKASSGVMSKIRTWLGMATSERPAEQSAEQPTEQSAKQLQPGSRAQGNITNLHPRRRRK